MTRAGGHDGKEKGIGRYGRMQLESCSVNDCFGSIEVYGVEQKRGPWIGLGV